MCRAIDFGSPTHVQLELVDIPHIYNAYGTLNPEAVTIPKGADNFDAVWCTYHWTFTDLGKTALGEVLRQDEWGVQQMIPHSDGVAYYYNLIWDLWGRA